MEKKVLVLLFVLACSLQLNAAAKDDKGDLTSVDDFSRCTKIKIKSLHVDDEVCVKIAYIKSEIGIEISITWDGKAIFKTKISVKNPPPICFNVPMVKQIKACLKLTDVSFQPHHHGACLAIEVKVIHLIDKTFKLGCIYKAIEQPKTPLEILQAVRALVNSNDIEKTGNEKADWLGGSDESGKGKKPKTFLDFLTSANMEEQVGFVDKISKTCSCTRPRQCICCKDVGLSPRYRTKVCGKVVGTEKGKGLWVSLVVDEVKHFRVYTPVSRRFKLACSKVQLYNTKTVICLQLRKVVQTVKGIDLCLSALVNARTMHRTSLGCMTVKIEEDQPEKQSDDLVKFEPIFKLVS